MEIKVVAEDSISINNKIFSVKEGKDIKAYVEETDDLIILWNANFPPSKNDLKFRKIFSLVYPKEFAGGTTVHIVVNKEAKEFYIIENRYELQLETIDIVAIPILEYKRTDIYGAFKTLDIRETPAMFELVNVIIPWEHVYFTEEVPRIISLLVEAESKGILSQKLKEVISLMEEKARNNKCFKSFLQALQSLNI